MTTRLFIILSLIIFITFFRPVSVLAQTTPFRFISWADTKSGLSTLNSLSLAAEAKNPAFLIYPGDVCDSGPTVSCLNTWKTNYNSGGDLFSLSFVSRGNHDASGTSTWQSYFNVPTVVSKIGALNYNSLSTNLTYSFDYHNSHFAAVDMPSGDATTITAAQLAWLDADLTAAESRGITHSFLFWHGPEYPMGGHCCTNAPSITTIINQHPSVSATFHGHEHILAYSHIDNTKITNVTHPYEEFITGGGGADLYGCQRGDWCQSTAGFATIDVNGPTFTVSMFNAATLLKTWSFTKAAVSPIPTPTPSSSDYQPNFPIRAAFYYPWFPESWTQGGVYPWTKYHPTLGFYSSADTATVAKHIQAMQYGGIQAGIASWWGQNHYTNTHFPGLLTTADGTNFRWTLYYENESLGDPTVAQITNDLTYIRDNYGTKPNYLRINGKFVVFVYSDAADACAMATRWHQANTVNAYIVLKVFAGFKTCGDQPDSWHQYSPAVNADSQPGYSYAISPGFDKYGEAARLTRNLSRWQTDVNNMIASNAPFQLVTTFNEWGEGTAVESASEWPSASGYGVYLDALHNKPGDLNGDSVVDYRDFKLFTSFYDLGSSIYNLFGFNHLLSFFGR